MAKALRTAALVVGAVALVATGIGAAAGAGLLGTAAASAGGTVLGMSVATISTIGTFASLGAAALSLGAALATPKPGIGGNATTFATNPQSGLPYAMGRTRMSGLRIFAKTNTSPGYTKFDDLLWFGALLSIGGQIEGIEKFTVDNEVVTFNGSGHAVGRFANYMSQKVHLGGPQASGLNVSLNGGTAPGWTAAHRLSGMTHAMWGLRFNKQGELFGAGPPEPAWVGKWVKVYDPRLDSTHPGGSGSCRPLVESSYVWSQNPGLHALTWALGRWENGKRTCGIGAPIANVRVHEFVECANVCDANGWKVGGVEWTTDSKWDTFKRILQAGGAVPTKTGAMIGCLVSMPRTAIATIETHHLLDQFRFPSTKSRRDRINTVIPRYIDEASDWATISGSAISVSQFITADRGQRTKEVDFPLVQVFEGEVATQPGQLAAYVIVNSREAGPFTWTTGPEFAGLKTGDVVYLNVPTEGLVNQPVLITRRAPDPASGKVSFAGETETYSKHAYALGQSTTPPSPFSLTAPDLKPTAPLQTSWTVSGVTSGEGFPALVVLGTSEMPSADAVIIDYRKSGVETWTNSAILSAIEPVRHVISPLESETAYDVRISYRVGTIDGNATLFANVITGRGKITVIEGQLTDLHDGAQEVVDGMIRNSLTIAEEALRDGTWRAQADDILKLPGGATLRQLVEQLGVTVGGVTTFVDFLRSVDTDGNAVWALTAQNSNGKVTGVRNLLTGEGLGTLQMAADTLEIVDPDGGNARFILRYGLDNRLILSDVYVENLEFGSVTTDSIAFNSVNYPYWVSLPSDVPMTKTVDNFPLTLSVPGVAAGELLKVVGAFSLFTTNDLTGNIIVQHIPPGGSAYDLRRQPMQLNSDRDTASSLTLPVVARVIAAQAGTHTFKLGYNPTGVGTFTAKAGTEIEVTRQRR
ncbi:MAG: hypothetical protein QHC67_01220 [Sphingobium sp.]|uniref:hypothetical protein n=1 Tax=Sphingobium sp. TaxID=1912891 RepID=UPI0029BAD07F|nr:hypothetical protein [Sphingobium sp.]MDX3908428.1 hypothetical protein [Sphingobium sp.]